MRTNTIVIFTLTAALSCTTKAAAQGPTASLQAGVTPTEYESEFEMGVALRVDDTYRRIKSGEESYPVPSLTAGWVIHH